MCEAGEDAGHLFGVFCFRTGISPPDGRAGPPRVWAVGVCGVGGGAWAGGTSACGFPADFPETPGSLPGGGEGSGAPASCPGFPVGTMPEWEGGPRSEEVAFRKMAFQASRNPPRALEAGGERPSQPPTSALSPGGTDVRGHGTLSTWFLPGAPAEAAGFREGLSAGPRLSQRFRCGFSELHVHPERGSGP